MFILKNQNPSRQVRPNDRSTAIPDILMDLSIARFCLLLFLNIQEEVLLFVFTRVRLTMVSWKESGKLSLLLISYAVLGCKNESSSRVSVVSFSCLLEAFTLCRPASISPLFYGAFGNEITVGKIVALTWAVIPQRKERTRTSYVHAWEIRMNGGSRWMIWMLCTVLAKCHVLRNNQI